MRKLRRFWDGLVVWSFFAMGATPFVHQFFVEFWWQGFTEMGAAWGFATAGRQMLGDFMWETKMSELPE